MLHFEIKDGSCLVYYPNSDQPGVFPAVFVGSHKDLKALNLPVDEVNLSPSVLHLVSNYYTIATENRARQEAWKKWVQRMAHKYPLGYDARSIRFFVRTGKSDPHCPSLILTLAYRDVRKTVKRRGTIWVAALGESNVVIPDLPVLEGEPLPNLKRKSEKRVAVKEEDLRNLYLFYTAMKTWDERRKEVADKIARVLEKDKAYIFPLQISGKLTPGVVVVAYRPPQEVQLDSFGRYIHVVFNKAAREYFAPWPLGECQWPF